jgi:hypothetical protein
MYFRVFPTTAYAFDLVEQSPKVVTNIFSRFSFNSAVLNNAFAFYKYQVLDGETPEIIAEKQYGDPGLHWVISLTNNLSDPIFELPLPRDALERKIIKKYGYSSIDNAYSEIHHYELETKKVLSEVNGPTTETIDTSIVTLDQYNYENNQIQTKPINIPVTETVSFYANNSNVNSATVATLTVTSTYKPVYVYEYEDQLNESKREIKILKAEYISALTTELETVLND